MSDEKEQRLDICFCEICREQRASTLLAEAMRFRTMQSRSHRIKTNEEKLQLCKDALIHSRETIACCLAAIHDPQPEALPVVFALVEELVASMAVFYETLSMEVKP